MSWISSWYNINSSTSQGLLSQWCSLDGRWSSVLMIMSTDGCCKLLTRRGRWTSLISMMNAARCLWRLMLI